MSTHPDAKLTIREAYEKHYDRSELTPNAVKKSRHIFTLWERLTGNPAIGEIDNATLTAFRQAAIEAEYKPWTINTAWNSVRAVLRCVGPQFTGNPWGLGIIDRVPAMKPVRIIRERPRIVSLDDLSRVYVACRHATSPRTGVAPSDWWRALLVTAYTTGLRRSDLFALQWDQLNLQDGTLTFTAMKTRKADLWPLHPVAVSHLSRIERADDGRVFRGLYNQGTSGLYKTLQPIQERAGVTRFTLHDLRRTGASQIEAICPGMAAEFLQHTPRSVTDISYLNRYEALRAALEKLPIPDGFKAGPKVAANREAKARAERVAMTQADFAVPTGPVPQDWAFKFGAFAYRGQWHPMPSGVRLAVLKRLAHDPSPLGWEEIVRIVRSIQPASKMATIERVSVVMAEIRGRLRTCLGLGASVDPVPCVQRIPPAWTLWIPQA